MCTVAGSGSSEVTGRYVKTRIGFAPNALSTWISSVAISGRFGFGTTAASSSAWARRRISVSAVSGSSGCASAARNSGSTSSIVLMDGSRVRLANQNDKAATARATRRADWYFCVLRPNRNLRGERSPRRPRRHLSMEAGYLGVGAMGPPMAHKLLDAGHSLTIYDINEAAMQPLLQRQARRAVSQIGR